MTKRLVLVYVLFLIVLIILADTGRASILFSIGDQIPQGDKLGHFFLMGFASFLITLSTRGQTMALGKHVVLKGPFWLSIVVTVEEVSQIWISSRGFSLLDLGFDYLGIVAFALLGALFIARNRRFESSG